MGQPSVRSLGTLAVRSRGPGFAATLSLTTLLLMTVAAPIAGAPHVRVIAPYVADVNDKDALVHWVDSDPSSTGLKERVRPSGMNGLWLHSLRLSGKSGRIELSIPGGPWAGSVVSLPLSPAPGTPITFFGAAPSSAR